MTYIYTEAILSISKKPDFDNYLELYIASKLFFFSKIYQLEKYRDQKASIWMLIIKICVNIKCACNYFLIYCLAD